MQQSEQSKSQKRIQKITNVFGKEISIPERYRSYRTHHNDIRESTINHACDAAEKCFETFPIILQTINEEYDRIYASFVLFYIYKTNKYLISSFNGKEDDQKRINLEVKTYETTPDKLLENKIIPQQSIDLIHKYFDDLPAINQFISGNKLVEFSRPAACGLCTLPNSKKALHHTEFVCKITITAPNNTYVTFYGAGMSLENAFVSAYLDMKTHTTIYDSFSNYNWFFLDNS